MLAILHPPLLIRGEDCLQNFEIQALKVVCRGEGNRGAYVRVHYSRSLGIVGPVFMLLFLFFSMLLLCSFFRLKELFQVKNGITTSILVFFENAQNLGQSEDGKRKKKGDGLMD